MQLGTFCSPSPTFFFVTYMGACKLHLLQKMYFVLQYYYTYYQINVTINGTFDKYYE